jgi:hypothetical protein
MQKVNLNAGRSRVAISPNIKRVSERVDIDGNVIDPRTKRMIRKADQEVTENKDENILRR